MSPDWESRTLPDRLGPDLRVLFVGINPGARSASVGHHYAGHSNRFWRLLHESRLVPEPLTWRDDERMLEWGYGLTNFVTRPTRGSAELTRADHAAGGQRLEALVRHWRPGLVALVGVTVYRTLVPSARRGGERVLGRRPERIGDAEVFVLPNPSGRNAAYTHAEMLAAFRALRRMITAGANRHRSEPPP